MCLCTVSGMGWGYACHVSAFIIQSFIVVDAQCCGISTVKLSQLDPVVFCFLYLACRNIPSC